MTSSAPKFALARQGAPLLFYVLGDPRATDSRRNPSWTPRVQLASKWDSKYAAKRAAKLLSLEDVQAYPVNDDHQVEN